MEHIGGKLGIKKEFHWYQVRVLMNRLFPFWKIKYAVLKYQKRKLDFGGIYIKVKQTPHDFGKRNDADHERNVDRNLRMFRDKDGTLI